MLQFKQQVGSLKLIPSTGGCFEITVNGQRIYSKLETGRFPEPDAVARTVQAMR